MNKVIVTVLFVFCSVIIFAQEKVVKLKAYEFVYSFTDSDGKVGELSETYDVDILIVIDGKRWKIYSKDIQIYDTIDSKKGVTDDGSDYINFTCVDSFGKYCTLSYMVFNSGEIALSVFLTGVTYTYFCRIME